VAKADDASLRPAAASDWPLIRSWLAEPHVSAWWGGRSSGEASVTIAMSAPSSLVRIVQAGGLPIGYAHALDIVLWGEDIPPGLPAGTWDSDLFIGSRAHLGQGYGLAALRLLTDELFRTTLAPAMCLVVSVRSERAVRLYESAGFRWHSIWNDRIDGPCWVMLCERP
jgi:aminoglycoside 6'-N-acetyltransferase